VETPATRTDMDLPRPLARPDPGDFPSIAEAMLQLDQGRCRGPDRCPPAWTQRRAWPGPPGIRNRASARDTRSRTL